MRVTRRLAFFGLAVFGVVVAIGAVALFASRLPEVDAQLSSKAVPLTVTIISPPNNSHWPMNAYVPVRASLSSRAPLEAIELWSDGMMLDSQPPEAASDPARTFRQWSWAAGKEGDHDLVVRVRTADGRIGTSNVVHVKATAAAETRRLVAAKAGDTLDTLAKAEGVAADQIQRENPGLASDAPLVAGQAVFIAEAPPPVPPGPSLGSLGPGLPPPPLPAPPATIAQAIAPAGQPTAASQTTTVSPQPKPTASQPPVAGGGTAAPSAGGSGQGAASPTPSTGQVPPTPPASGGIDGVKGQWVMSEPHYGEISGLRAFPAWLHDLWQQFGVDLGGGQPPKTPQTAGQSGSDPGKANKPSVQGPQNCPQGQSESKPANPPGIAVAAQGCAAVVTVADKSSNEAGFRIYRADPEGDAFKPISFWCSSTNHEMPLFTDYGRSGHVVYQAASFNSAGESFSSPASVDITDGSCTVSGEVKIDPQSGILYTPPNIDRVYLYASVNKEVNWERLPNNPNEFLPMAPTGGWYLDSFLAGYLPAIDGEHPTVDGRVWGWQGGTVVELGEVHLKLERTTLFACKGAPKCPVDTAGKEALTTDTDVIAGAPDQRREFFWNSGKIGKQTGGRWQVSTMPFGQVYDPNQPGLVASGEATGGNGSFTVDFAKLSPVRVDWQGRNRERTYYVRFAPFSGSQPISSPSNTVTIHYRPKDVASDSGLPHMPPIYEVQIVDYKFVGLPDPAYWGCVVVAKDYYQPYPPMMGSYGGSGFGGTSISQKPDWDDPGCWEDSTSPTCKNGHQKQQIYKAGIVCPAAYEAPSEASVLWGYITGQWDWLANKYEELKHYIASPLAELIDDIPGVDCSPGSSCENALAWAAGQVISYITDLPASLPTSKELQSLAIEEAVEVVAQELTGYDIPCEDICKKAIRKVMVFSLDQLTGGNKQPGCVDDGTAQAHGKKPLCMPAGIEFEPYGPGTYRPGAVIVQVTRKQTPADVTVKDAPKYRVAIRAEGENPGRAGTWAASCGYTESAEPKTGHYLDNGAWVRDTYQLPGLTGKLFQDTDATIPWLEPGKSALIPIPLELAEYWWPGHRSDIARDYSSWTYEGWRGRCGDDWPYLYYSGVSKVKASVVCEVPAGGIMLDCDSTDHKDYDNPTYAYWE